LFASAALKDRASLLGLAAPHIKYLEGEHRGYLLIDLTRARLQADWYHVPTVSERTDREQKAASWVSERGSSRLAPA
jgi:alkaline phosphatase D